MRTWLLVCACAALASCGGPAVDVDQGLSVELLTTGWKDDGLVQGKTKLVPSASVKLKNVSSEKLPAVQVNAVFRRAGDPGEWGSVFVPAPGWTGLAPGGTATLTLRSPYGRWRLQQDERPEV